VTQAWLPWDYGFAVRRFLARAPADDPRAAEARSALARLSAGGAGGG